MLSDRDRKLLYLHRHGSSVPIPARLCRLGMEDYDEIMALNSKVYREVGDEDIYASENSIERNLSGEGFALGVKAGGLLVALCVFSWVLEDMFKVVEGTYLDSWSLEQFAMRDIVVVDSDFRGNGLHRMLISASGSFIPSSRRYVISTVSPRNWASLKNVLAEGYYVVSCKKLYGGHTRFVTWQDLDDPMVIARPLHLRIPAEEVEHHRRVLAMGAVGYELDRAGPDVILRYGKGIRRSMMVSSFLGDSSLLGDEDSQVS
ncbi:MULTISPECIES: hypothetical protein [Dethiosulfovibrio]|uniref:N-acetyltransferase domain-containing protein n=2 Tax=Dethiosulfovibrio TaxID=47054 RepID=A0ABS9ESZ7_9BACT|nr:MULTISPECIES: hypothetical protein [Dethiosulfovibrio]MCF4114840.1 hypothetical protein [Dethiosulfovibrio russensis]MCF4143237.1 hypothetical protein [Dethiosulfovibrio marinus]MCF4145345.1 hypothetical protein [Dethiosulfovibrio acidaminovorans]